MSGTDPFIHLMCDKNDGMMEQTCGTDDSVFGSHLHLDQLTQSYVSLVIYEAYYSYAIVFIMHIDRDVVISGASTVHECQSGFV